jgi:hypothetical protein
MKKNCNDIKKGKSIIRYAEFPIVIMLPEARSIIFLYPINPLKHNISDAMKLHMRGAQNFYYFGVPEYVVMIEIL